MTEDIKNELDSDSAELSDFHKELLEHVMELVKMSRTRCARVTMTGTTSKRFIKANASR